MKTVNVDSQPKTNTHNSNLSTSNKKLVTPLTFAQEVNYILIEECLIE